MHTIKYIIIYYNIIIRVHIRNIICIYFRDVSTCLSEFYRFNINLRFMMDISKYQYTYTIRNMFYVYKV